MNIFEMYYDNDKSVGFWVVRDSWKNFVARVVSIGGIESGPLKGLGRYPYFNDAKEAVLIEMYKVIESDEGVKFEQIIPDFQVSKESNQLAILSCPGTYSYRRVVPRDSIIINKLATKTV